LEPTIETTADGSATLRSPLNGETYHSLRGAVGEARHVFIEAGFAAVTAHGTACTPNATVGAAGTTRSATTGAGAVGTDVGAADACADYGTERTVPGRVLHSSHVPETAPARDAAPVRVLEMGFGSGLNAWLTLTEGARTGRRVEYVGVELHPVAEEVAARLGYTDDARFMALHRAPWGVWTEPAEGFRLLKLHTDLAAADFLTTFVSPPNAENGAGGVGSVTANNLAAGTIDVVYWDAFAPDTQPELWTAELFARVAALVRPGGVLVTYSAKGDVRRALAAAGFAVERLPGALGKRHMLRAVINC